MSSKECHPHLRTHSLIHSTDCTLKPERSDLTYVISTQNKIRADALLRLCLHMTFRPDEAVKTKCNGRDLWSVISEGLNFLLQNSTAWAEKKLEYLSCEQDIIWGR